MVAYIVFAVRGRSFFQTYVCDVMSLWQWRHFMNQIGQTNYEIGVMFKSLLSISMMRCRFLMCQHILRTPGNTCIYSLCRKFICNDLNSSGVNRSGFYFNMASKISKGYGRRHAPMNNLIRLFCQLKLLYGRGHEISPVRNVIYTIWRRR